MTDRDDVLRGAVWAAFDARGGNGSREACEQVIRVHTLWSYIAHARAIELAQAEMGRRADEYESWLLETAARLCPGD